MATWFEIIYVVASVIGKAVVPKPGLQNYIMIETLMTKLENTLFVELIDMRELIVRFMESQITFIKV